MKYIKLYESNSRSNIDKISDLFIEINDKGFNMSVFELKDSEDYDGSLKTWVCSYQVAVVSPNGRNNISEGNPYSETSLNTSIIVDNFEKIHKNINAFGNLFISLLDRAKELQLNVSSYNVDLIENQMRITIVYDDNLKKYLE
jgi:hypothetical protein